MILISRVRSLACLQARSYPELADIDFASLDQLISEMDSLAAAKKTRSQPEEQADPDFTAELDAEQKQQEQLKAKELDIQLNIRELEAETSANKRSETSIA